MWSDTRHTRKWLQNKTGSTARDCNKHGNKARKLWSSDSLSNLCRPTTWIRFQRKWWLTAAGRNCRGNTVMMVSIWHTTLYASGSQPSGVTGEKHTHTLHTGSSEALNHRKWLLILMVRTYFEGSSSCTCSPHGLYTAAISHTFLLQLKKWERYFQYFKIGVFVH